MTGGAWALGSHPGFLCRRGPRSLPAGHSDAASGPGPALTASRRAPPGVLNARPTALPFPEATDPGDTELFWPPLPRCFLGLLRQVAEASQRPVFSLTRPQLPFLFGDFFGTAALPREPVLRSGCAGSRLPSFPPVHRPREMVSGLPCRPFHLVCHTPRSHLGIMACDHQSNFLLLLFPRFSFSPYIFDCGKYI